jgi:hypothetical protein
MFALRAQRAGLDTSEYDFSALEAVPLRGYAIVNKQSPSKEMELFSRVYDIDVYEDFMALSRVWCQVGDAYSDHSGQ